MQGMPQLKRKSEVKSMGEKGEGKAEIIPNQGGQCKARAPAATRRKVRGRNTG